MNCILPRTVHKTDVGTLCLLSCLEMTAPMGYFVFWCGHSRDSIGCYYVTASWVLYLIRTTRCDHSPCSKSGCSTPHNMIQLDNHHRDRQNENKKTVPWLSSSRSDWHVLRVMANQRQPQYTHNVLQRRFQPNPTIILYFGWG